VTANTKNKMNETLQTDKDPNDKKRLNCGDVIRMKHYPTRGGFRCWKVIGCHLGGTNQESTYALKPLDVLDNHEIHVPCLMLENHTGVERV